MKKAVAQIVITAKFDYEDAEGIVDEEVKRLTTKGTNQILDTVTHLFDCFDGITISDISLLSCGEK